MSGRPRTPNSLKKGRLRVLTCGASDQAWAIKAGFDLVDDPAKAAQGVAAGRVEMAGNDLGQGLDIIRLEAGGEFTAGEGQHLLFGRVFEMDHGAAVQEGGGQRLSIARRIRPM